MCCIWAFYFIEIDKTIKYEEAFEGSKVVIVVDSKMDETIPDIYQSKKMAVLYNMSLDELIDFDIDIKEIQGIIDKTNEEIEEKIDWTNAWGKKYPILVSYQKKVNHANYARRLCVMLEELKQEY